MKMKQKKQVDLFSVINVVILTGLSLLCLMPIINVLAISFSERAAVEAGKVVFWPVDFTTAAYEYVLKDRGFLDSLMVSIARVIVGPVLNLVLCILCAYPLSKSDARFRGRLYPPNSDRTTARPFLSGLKRYGLKYTCRLFTSLTP